MKPSDLIAQLRGTKRHPVEVEIVTQERCDLIAYVRRSLHLDPPDPRYAMPNPLFPIQPAAPLDAPGIDCAILDRGRCS